MTTPATLLMIPGAYFQPGDFAAQGITASLAAHTVTAIEVPPSPERYLDGDIGDWLHEHHVAPLAGQRIWMLGISLGAMGALMHATAHPNTVEGLILLAPFLGTRGLIAEATAAGGLTNWNPGAIAASDIERRLLASLAESPLPAIHLGCGTQDRYAGASHLLAGLLPAHQVHWRTGGHDWPCWRTLWSQILETLPFASGPTTTKAPAGCA